MKYMLIRSSKIGNLYWNSKEWSNIIEAAYIFNSLTSATNIAMIVGGNVVEVSL